ncbi:MAG: murein biosynthesis integral membrane protein MurJ [Clostridia bacterium]|nr:murein biosynthesis integral membrane protein MurJ [Clostridia bacterium]
MSSATGKVIRAAGILLIMNLLSRVLGYVRDAVIAGHFGTSGATDAYMVAYTIPYFLQSIVGMAFVMIIVPILTDYGVKGKREEMWKAASVIFNWTALFLTAAALMGILGAEILVKLMAPGFSGELAILARELTRIIMPSIIFMGLGMLVTGILNSQHVFSVPAFAPAAENIAIILTVVFLSSKLGIHGLALGTLVGFMFFLFIQIPSLKKLNFRYFLSFDSHHPALIQAASEIIPIIFGVGVNQIYLALNRAFASFVAEGSISAIDFAYRLINLPLGIFAATISTLIFPSMSEHAASGNKREYAGTLTRGLNLVSFIIIPSAVGLWVLSTPVVELLFQRGAFDQRATVMTAAALAYFTLGMYGWSANMVIIRAYYAVKDTKPPVFAGVIAIIVNILLSYLFLPFLGHRGLPLANSIAVTVQTALLMILITKHLPDMEFSSMGKTFAKALAASMLMGAGVYLIASEITFPAYAETAICIGAGVILYILAAYIFRIEEISVIGELAARKFTGVR